MYGIRGNQTFAEYELDGDQVNSQATEWEEAGGPLGISLSAEQLLLTLGTMTQSQFLAVKALLELQNVTNTSDADKVASGPIHDALANGTVNLIQIVQSLTPDELAFLKVLLGIGTSTGPVIPTNAWMLDGYPIVLDGHPIVLN